MGRLIVSAQLTVDAVLDQVEGWYAPDAETDARGLDQLRAADALLLGRRTYEHFAAAWPGITGPPGFPELMNGLPKYVASRTLSGPLRWNATLLAGDDVAAEVRKLKQRLAGDLLSYGCGELAAGLAAAGLVDEIRFWVYPVVWGDGVRAFDGGDPPVRMRLIGATAFRAGVTLLRYQPAVAGGQAKN